MTSLHHTFFTDNPMLLKLMWIDRWCRVRFVCRWGHKVASLKMNAARMRTNPRYWSSGWFVEHSSKSLQIHVSLKICILLRCHCKGSYFEGEKEIYEVNFFQFFSFTDNIFGWFWCWSVIKSQFLIAVWGLLLKRMAISRPQPFPEQVIFAENLHGQGQWEDNAKIVMSDHKVGHRHRNRTVCDKTAGYLSLRIVTIRVPKESLFFY